MRRRRNPVTDIVQIAYDPKFIIDVRELIADTNLYGFEEAAAAIADWHSMGLEETRTLGLLAIRNRLRHKDAVSAIRWLTHRDQRMGVWCACVCLSIMQPNDELVGSTPYLGALSLLKDIQRWVADDSTADFLKKEISLYYDEKRAGSRIPWRAFTNGVCGIGNAAVNASKWPNYHPADYAAYGLEYGAFASAEGKSNALRDMMPVLRESLMSFPRKRANTSE